MGSMREAGGGAPSRAPLKVELRSVQAGGAEIGGGGCGDETRVHAGRRSRVGRGSGGGLAPVGGVRARGARFDKAHV